MPNKMNQLPTVLLVAVIPHIGVISSAAERGHPSKSHAVLDNPEQLAVAQVLGGGQAHVWRLGVEIAPHFGGATAVVGMAARAVIRKVLPR